MKKIKKFNDSLDHHTKIIIAKAIKLAKKEVLTAESQKINKLVCDWVKIAADEKTNKK